MRLKSLATAVVALMATATLASAQSQCAKRDLVVKRLSDRYHESFTGGGLRDGQAVFEVWASEAEGTWTILMTQADGTSCIMASGTHWRGSLPTDMVKGIPG